jgi:Mu transposase, C-terminal domain
LRQATAGGARLVECPCSAAADCDVAVQLELFGWVQHLEGAFELDSDDYSVHSAVIGRRIEVSAHLHRVRVICDRTSVGDRAWVWAKPRPSPTRHI